MFAIDHLCYGAIVSLERRDKIRRMVRALLTMHKEITITYYARWKFLEMEKMKRKAQGASFKLHFDVDMLAFPSYEGDL